jgi:hypothetical protein
MECTDRRRARPFNRLDRGRRNSARRYRTRRCNIDGVAAQCAHPAIDATAYAGGVSLRRQSKPEHDRQNDAVTHPDLQNRFVVSR